MAFRTIHRSHPYLRILSSCHAALPAHRLRRGRSRAGSPLSKLEAQYQSETNPVRKAKLLAKLGPLEVDEAARKINADQDDAGAVRARTISRRCPEDHRCTRLPRKRMRRATRLASRNCRSGSENRSGGWAIWFWWCPAIKQPRFEAVRSDLSATQNSLIEALFPSPKEKREKDGKAD